MRFKIWYDNSIKKKILRQTNKYIWWFLDLESEGSVVRRHDLLSDRLQASTANDVTLDDRLNCTEGDVQPPNRVDTSER